MRFTRTDMEKELENISRLCVSKHLPTVALGASKLQWEIFREERGEKRDGEEDSAEITDENVLTQDDFEIDISIELYGRVKVSTGKQLVVM